MRRLLVAAVAVVLVPLVGCSEEEPKAEPTPEPSVSESVAPKEETAEEFIRRWLEIQQELQRSGDGAEMLATSGRCDACVKAVHAITGYYEAGGYVSPGTEVVVSIEKRQGVNGVYDVTTDIGPSQFRESADSPERKLEGGRARYVLTLEKSAGSWQVVDLMRGSV